MQFIQLQGQNPNTTPSAGAGAVNVFLDQSTGTLAIKDQYGEMVTTAASASYALTASYAQNSAGGSQIEVTVQNLRDMVSSSMLTAGAYYKITDPSYGQAIVLKAETTSSLSDRGWGYFYNPRYEAPLTYLTYNGFPTQSSGKDGYFVYDNTLQIDISSISGFFYSWENVTADNGAVGQLIGDVSAYGSGKQLIPFQGSNDWSAATTITGDWSGATANVSIIRRPYVVSFEDTSGYNYYINTGDYYYFDGGYSGYPVKVNTYQQWTWFSTYYTTANRALIETDTNLYVGQGFSSSYNPNITWKVSKILYNPEYQLGDKVIWNGMVYENITGDPAKYYDNGPDLPDWQLVPYNDTDYDLVVNEAGYDIYRDCITYRKDEYNEVIFDVSPEEIMNRWSQFYNGYFLPSIPSNPIEMFPWGNPSVFNAKISNPVTAPDLLNFSNFNKLSNFNLEELTTCDMYFYSPRNIWIDGFSVGHGSRFPMELYQNTTVLNVNLKPMYPTDDYGGWQSYVILERNSILSNFVAEGWQYTNLSLYESEVTNMNLSQECGIELELHGTYIDGFRMKNWSWIENVVIYDGYIREITMEEYAYMQNVQVINNGSVDWLEVVLGPDSYFGGSFWNTMYVYGDLNLYKLTCAANTQLIFGVAPTTNMEIASVEVGSNSYLTLDSSDSYSQYFSCYFNEINMENGTDLAVNFYQDSAIHNLSMKPSATANFTLNAQTSVNSISMGVDSYASLNTVGDYCTIEGTFHDNSSFQGAPISSSNVSLEIGQDFYFNGYNYYPQSNEITSSRSLRADNYFNNFACFPTAGSSNTDVNQYQSLSTPLNSMNTVHYMDVTGKTDTSTWYLNNRQTNIEGAQNTFLLKSSGSLAVSASQVWIFLDNVRKANGEVTGSARWWPFSLDSNAANWRNTAIATWIDGAWNVDNSHIY